ncbi:SMP-30/gluconolactonase/LRE family protein [Mycobacterium sp. C31M]
MTVGTAQLLDGLVFPEGPRWHDGELWFSDMFDGRVFAVDEQGRSRDIVTVPGRPSGLGWLPDGRLLVISMQHHQLLRLDSSGLQSVADLGALVTGELNDMVVDAKGTAYIGSTGVDATDQAQLDEWADTAFDGEAPARGNIVAVRPDGEIRVVAEAMSGPNGMVITPDQKTLIVAETAGHRLTAFDLGADGSLSGRRVFADLPERMPDGICLDAQGYVWAGCPFTQEFVRVGEGGVIADRIELPGRLGVACMLGGADRRTLFLLTAEATVEDLMQGKSKGSIETVRVDVEGAGTP